MRCNCRFWFSQKERGFFAQFPFSQTRYIKRLGGELRSSAGLNFSDGYRATAVCRALTSGGTFVSYGKKLPKYVSYDGAAQRPVEWDAFIKEKNLKVLNF